MLTVHGRGQCNTFILYSKGVQVMQIFTCNVPELLNAFLTNLPSRGGLQKTRAVWCLSTCSVACAPKIARSQTLTQRTVDAAPHEETPMNLGMLHMADRP